MRVSENTHFILDASALVCNIGGLFHTHTSIPSLFSTRSLFPQRHINVWESHAQDVQLAFPDGDELLKTYQNPAEADKLFKIQKDLAEVRQREAMREALYES